MTESDLNIESMCCPLPLPHNERIVMGHGSGGRMSFDLIRKIFLSSFENQVLGVGDDAGAVDVQSIAGVSGKRLAVSTDSHVVTPLFFPGGDIGRLSICGTVNDVAMLGATPLFLTAGFILEEGLEVQVLQKVVHSMCLAANEANVKIIAGDTKVVQNGKADGLYINTTGIGIIPDDIYISGTNAQPGDVIILSGTIGDHGIAVLAARGELNFDTQVVSDMAPLNSLVAAMLGRTRKIHVLRDPTRGGLATSLNEIAQQSQVEMTLIEDSIPIKPGVNAACEMLGFDPLYVANEGKLIAFVARDEADNVLSTMREHPLGSDATIIGTVGDKSAPRVILRTKYGTTRLVDMLSGEMTPRIC